MPEGALPGSRLVAGRARPGRLNISCTEADPSYDTGQSYSGQSYSGLPAVEKGAMV
jgi:hypothetical protein